VGTTLDGQALFDEQDLNIHVGTWQRASIERAISGLNGMVSIDLGRRDRQIRQRGILRAASHAALQSRVASLECFLDGDSHTLVTAEGQEYANLRMDAFKPLEADVTGAGLTIGYEITYTQLGSRWRCRSGVRVLKRFEHS